MTFEYCYLIKTNDNGLICDGKMLLEVIIGLMLILNLSYGRNRFQIEQMLIAIFLNLNTRKNGECAIQIE